MYAGQMLKPPHDVARRAYEMALKINPNNHALDGGRASSAMEKEAVAALAHMTGWGGGGRRNHAPPVGGGQGEHPGPLGCPAPAHPARRHPPPLAAITPAHRAP